MVASPRRGPVRRRADRVSIPFIAGQWSLLMVSFNTSKQAATGFNPLHCGAVVASRPRRERLPHAAPGFNPLHCGAVVASGGGAGEARRRAVSIPFIAGQWSLRPVRRRRLPAAPEFQSPSLRGSGRFFRYPAVRLETVVFQSPSLRGSGRFPQPPRSPYGGRGASFNPLHCGAVVASC